ncbi:MAG: ABC transporter permease [Erysipelotrichaceae bacterium]|nr:ABC transporter permease [Erysipelotrichaceae bacterium]
MKHLIYFSLKRRFLNPISIALQVLFISGLLILFNLDHVSSALHLDLTKPYPIQVSRETQDQLISTEYWEKQGLKLTEETSSISIDFKEDVFEVKGAASLSLQAKIYGLLLKSHQQRILNESHPSVSDFVMVYNSVPVTFDSKLDPMTGLRENLVFMILTSVYFMMLNFISVNSNEIIQEKSSNVLEFILTSVSPFQHFCAKILTGLITVILQIALSGGIFGLVLMARLNTDQGRGLFALANKYFALDSSGISYETLLSLFKFDGTLILKATLALLFLILGLLIIQVLILILSARVKTIEEAGSIQGPFYLGLLGLYYLSLILNTPAQLIKGVGVTLSYIPISSMLMMGMRILSTNVAYDELSLSLLISLFTLVLIMWLGFGWYRKGLVNE